MYVCKQNKKKYEKLITFIDQDLKIILDENLLKENNIQIEIKKINNFLSKNPKIADDGFTYAGVYVLFIPLLNIVYVGLATDLSARAQTHENDLRSNAQKNATLRKGFGNLQEQMPEKKIRDLFQERYVQFIPIFQFPCQLFLDRNIENKLKDHLAGLKNAARMYFDFKTKYIVANQQITSTIEKKTTQITFFNFEDLNQMYEVLNILQKEKLQRSLGQIIENLIEIGKYFKSTKNISLAEARIANERPIVSIKEKKYFPLLQFVSINSDKHQGNHINTIKRVLDMSFFVPVEDRNLRYAFNEEILKSSYIKEYDNQEFLLSSSCVGIKLFSFFLLRRIFTIRFIGDEFAISSRIRPPRIGHSCANSGGPYRTMMNRNVKISDQAKTMGTRSSFPK